MTNLYRCDICESEGGLYYDYNSTYGYCDKESCRKEARRRLSEDIHEHIEHGDLDLAEELVGDEDIFYYL